MLVSGRTVCSEGREFAVFPSHDPALLFSEREPIYEKGSRGLSPDEIKWYNRLAKLINGDFHLRLFVE